MPDDGQVSFQSDNADEFRRPVAENAKFDLSGSLVNAGLVSSRQEAQYVMIGIVALALLLSGYFAYRSLGNTGAPPPPPVSDATNVSP